MDSAGVFTDSDLATIRRAAWLARGLTERYFGLAEGYWKLHPCKILTRKQADKWFYEPDAFASVVRYGTVGKEAARSLPKERSYGIVLQDPNILRALLRSSTHDLWTFGLFILTHELVHVVRFTKFDVDFWAGGDKRLSEENLVRQITGRMLSGVTNTDYVLNLYKEEMDKQENTATKVE